MKYTQVVEVHFDDPKMFPAMTAVFIEDDKSLVVRRVMSYTQSIRETGFEYRMIDESTDSQWTDLKTPKWEKIILSPDRIKMIRVSYIKEE